MNKKGFSLQDMAPLAIAFVVIAVVLGVGATIVGTIRADSYASNCASLGGVLNSSDAQAVFCATAANNSVANTTTQLLDATTNASTNGLSSLTTLSGWLPTIAVIVAAAVVIGIIVAYFKF